MHWKENVWKTQFSSSCTNWVNEMSTARCVQVTVGTWFKMILTWTGTMSFFYHLKYLATSSPSHFRVFQSFDPYMADCFLKHNYPIIVCHADWVWQKSHELLHCRMSRALLHCYEAKRVSGSSFRVKRRFLVRIESLWWRMMDSRWKMTGFIVLSLLSATQPEPWASLHSHLPLPALFFFSSSQDFSVWWGQIPPQRVHRGNANPTQEAEAQPNQKLQQLPGETVTCKSNVPHRYLLMWCGILTE